MSTLDRLYAPQWAGGWTFTRLLFGVAAVHLHVLRASGVTDALAAPSFVLSSGPTRVADHVLLGAAAAWPIYAVGVLGIVGIFYGGRLAKPGLIAWFVSEWVLLTCMGLSVRVPERMMIWATLALLVSPIGERGLVNKARGPVGRHLLLVVTMALYGSTGFMKMLEEPAWWSGTALPFDLVDRHHAGGALAAWVSGQGWLCAILGWGTIVFEMTYPFLILFPPLSPFVLLVGAGMHGTIELLMRVGGLGTIAVSLYPVLLDPEVGLRLWRKALARWPGLAWIERA